MSRTTMIAVGGLIAIALAAAGWWSFRDQPDDPITYRYFSATMVAQRPVGEPRSLIVLVAPAVDDSRTAAIGQTFIGEDVAYVIVALPQLSDAAAQTGKTCVDFERMFHASAKDAEHRLGFADFRVPMLGGVGTGALAAYTGYRQSAPGMWAGVLTVDRPATLNLPKPPCNGWGTPTGGPGEYAIDLKHRVGETWVDLPGLSVGRLESMISPLFANVQADKGEGNLPLTLVSPAAPDPAAPYVVMYSGDGGWAGFDRAIAAEFARRGYQVAGISSLEYFWQERQPAEAARDLQALVTANAGSRKVLLVGYSFGADVLPFIYDALPPQTKARVVRLDLLGFSGSADFQFHLGSWANIPSGASRPTVPFVDNLRDVDIRCIRGLKETASACTSLLNPAIEQIPLPGDHHFNGDAKAVVDALSRN